MAKALGTMRDRLNSSALRYALTSIFIFGMMNMFIMPAFAFLGEETFEDASDGQGDLGQKLYVRAKYGDLAGVVNALVLGAEINSLSPNTGRSSLSVAAENNHDEVVEFLLENGANIEIRDHYTRITPLYMAAYANSTKALDVLLRWGADTDAKSAQSERYPLMAAVKGKSYDALRILAKNRANLELRDIHGRTPVGMAAVEGDSEALKILVKNGARVNVRDVRGISPVYAASVKGHRESLLILLKNGADPSIKDSGGRDTFEATLLSGQFESYRLLMAAKGELNKTGMPAMDVFELLQVNEDEDGKVAVILAAGKIVYAREGQIEKDCFRVIKILRDGVLIFDFRDMSERALWLRYPTLLKMPEHHTLD